MLIMLTRKILFVFIALTSFIVSIAQTTKITGRVFGQDNNAVAAVSITVKGSSIATSSANDGSFSIDVPQDARSVLVFTSVGFQPLEIETDNKTFIEARITDDSKEMQDVVVVGYGTQRKSDLTGAVSSIRGDKLREMPVVSIEQAMQGRMAGVQVQQTSGQPGAGISIRIRGVSSIAGGNEPLYVIDGLPQFNDDVRGANGLATINPSDIESIEVLKDASATAIYGSRGANGVVMITTKSGKAGQPRVS